MTAPRRLLSSSAGGSGWAASLPLHHRPNRAPSPCCASRASRSSCGWRHARWPAVSSGAVERQGPGSRRGDEVARQPCALPMAMNRCPPIPTTGRRPTASRMRSIASRFRPTASLFLHPGSAGRWRCADERALQEPAHLPACRRYRSGPRCAVAGCRWQSACAGAVDTKPKRHRHAGACSTRPATWFPPRSRCAAMTARWCRCRSSTSGVSSSMATTPRPLRVGRPRVGHA